MRDFERNVHDREHFIASGVAVVEDLFANRLYFRRLRPVNLHRRLRRITPLFRRRRGCIDVNTQYMIKPSGTQLRFYSRPFENTIVLFAPDGTNT
jgi:hypothetical protein